MYSSLLAPTLGLVLGALRLDATPLLEKIDLLESGAGGYALYRIPGLAVTAAGTVLACCEARRTGKSDWDTIDCLLLRSTDGGRSWSASRKLADVPGPKVKNPVALEKGLANPEDVTYNNPLLIAERGGAVHFLFCLDYSRCFHRRSGDDGRTWSAPREITATFESFRPGYAWRVIATGPGHGIEMENGRLVVPVWLSTGTGGHAHRPSVCSVITSDDSGRTWRAGQIAVPNTDEWVFPSETAAAQLANGRVMLNVRSESKAHRRIVVYSRDGATGWSRPRFDDALPEPVCMASLARFSKKPGGDRNRLLFSNPANLERADGKAKPGGSRDRRNLSVRLSYDEGRSWAATRALEPGHSAYSDLAVLPGGTVLCLYERGRPGDTSPRPTSCATLTLARFNLEWLTDGRDIPPRADGRNDFGARREEFQVAGCDAFVIHPTRPAPGGARPWVWYAPTISEHPDRANAWLFTRLLARGFAIAGICVGETFANPESRDRYADFHRFVTARFGLAPKACLVAQSRGGLNHYHFAADHPDWVACIAGIYAVGDLRSFPGLKRAAPAYGLTEAELAARLAQHNPIERLAPIARARIPILHVHGDADTTVPLERNSGEIRARLARLGASMELAVAPGKGHQFAPEFFESERMLGFLTRHGLGRGSEPAR